MLSSSFLRDRAARRKPLRSPPTGVLKAPVVATPAQAIVDPSLVDLTRVSAWMDAQGLPRGEIGAVTLLGGGTQNILLRFERGGRAFVLRRPPEHKRANSDETMRREARVLGAIRDTPVPHPRLIAACAETDVIGAAFYLMEPIAGFNPTTGLPDLHSSSTAVRHAMGLEMVDAIAALGAVDHVAVGLEGFGRPEGYLERQVARWRAHLAGYDELEGYPGPEIPGVERVATWLEDNRPARFEPGILHGDFHLGNVMFRHDGPELAAIVDWELSTIGDPLLDLGWLLATWPDETGQSAGVVMVAPWDGFPAARELIERYRERSRRDLSAIAWYEVLACYKLGIILEGTHARACAGKAPKVTGDMLHAATVALFERALKRIASA
jgi:aminoglycoside phosphotransferase (APT) family kinase protein